MGVSSAMVGKRKGTSTLQRGSVDGCQYTIVDNNGVDFFYGLATPVVTGNARDQIFSAFDSLQSALDKAEFTCPVKLNVFLRRIGDKQLVRSIKDYLWNEQCQPATTFIAQAPCNQEHDVVLELIAVDTAKSDELSHPVDIYECNERATVIEYDDVMFGFFGGFVPDEESLDAYERSYSAFTRMRNEVETSQFRFANVFRTWLYQGSIVLPEGDSQRYKELNAARSDFFYGMRFLERFLPRDVKYGAVYPGSTGIGADDVDVAMSCMAIKSQRDDIIVAPIENPLQTSAFDYSERYSPQSPKFSRAVALAFNDRARVYVSGTASIVDQKTVHVDDPEGQTNQTLDNIEALIAGENLERYGVRGFDANLKDLATARVYVKKPEHYDAIRAICEKRLKGVPTVYTYADVCRDDLLVEVEGIASCRVMAKE